MIKLLVAITAVLALFVGTAGPAVAAPNKTVTHSGFAYLVDDDGVTRNFAIIYYYVPATRDASSRTTCSYGLQKPGSALFLAEGSHTAYGTTPITNRGDGLAYCVSVFNDRIRANPDPTPAPTG